MHCERTYYAAERLFHGFVPRVMGTRFELLLAGVDPDPAEACWDAVTAVLEELAAPLDRFDPHSEVATFNARRDSSPMRVGPVLEEALHLCGRYFELTEGLFDPTRADFGGLTISDEWIVRRDAGLTLDFGGFAKGFALRRIGERLREASVGAAFVDFGGSSILAVGSHPWGACWRVSLTNPWTGASLRDFELRDRALSTSGNTPVYTGHIVDPTSGRCIDCRRMTTVVAEDALDAEVLSTVLMIADAERRERILARFPQASGEIYEL